MAAETAKTVVEVGPSFFSFCAALPVTCQPPHLAQTLLGAAEEEEAAEVVAAAAAVANGVALALDVVAALSDADGDVQKEYATGIGETRASSKRKSAEAAMAKVVASLLWWQSAGEAQASSRRC